MPGLSRSSLVLHRTMPVRAARLNTVPAAISRSAGAGFATGSGSAPAPALRLYRSLLRARRQFPVDEKRAAAGRDMRTLSHSRIRNAFEQSRTASGAQVGNLLQTGEEQLHALRTIGTNHFANEVRHPSLLSQHSVPLPSLSPFARMCASTLRVWATMELRMRTMVPGSASKFSVGSGRAEPMRSGKAAWQCCYQRTKRACTCVVCIHLQSHAASASRALLGMGCAGHARRFAAALLPPMVRPPV